LADVRQFSTPGHPAFSPSSDGANAVAFNHALHLSKGLTQTPDAAPFTWERLPPEERRRYGLSADTPATTPVQLACADCHRIEPDARARMTPPRYQEDCRACHPLGFDPKHAELQIPHGLQVDQVVAKLQETFAARAVLESPATLKAALSATQRWLPGHGDPADPTVAQAIDRNVGDALRLLFQASAQGTSRRGCVGCHTFDPGLPTVPSPKSLSGVRVRSVHRDRPWFSSGVFNHKAHRSSQCTECHAAAGTSEKSDDILLPSIDTCLKCHDAASRRSSPGGASSACVECHRYHPPALTSADTLGAPPDPVEVPQR
jgi:hypothetical protein